VQEAESGWTVEIVSTEGVHEIDVVAELSEEPVFLTCSAATPQRARRFVATGQRVRPR
jgi:hypothetical protein